MGSGPSKTAVSPIPEQVLEKKSLIKKEELETKTFSSGGVSNLAPRKRKREREDEERRSGTRALFLC